MPPEAVEPIPQEIIPEALPEAAPVVEEVQEEPPAELDKELGVEALAAVVGALPRRPIKADDRLVAQRLPEKWRTKVRAFLRGDVQQPQKPPSLDLDKTLEDITEPVDDLRQLLAEVADPTVATTALDVIVRGREYLNARFPTVVIQNVVAPELAEVSPVEKLRIEALFRVVDEPIFTIDEMLSRTLEPDQATALRTVYPRLYEMLEALIWDEITRLPKKSRLSWDKELMLRILWDIPPQVAITTPRAKVQPQRQMKTLEKLETKAQRISS